MFLIGVKYVGAPKNKIVMQFVQDGHLKIVDDSTGFLSYFYVGADAYVKDDSRIKRIETVETRNLMVGPVKLRKIYVDSPLAVGGEQGISNLFGEEAWENDQKVVEVYIADNKLRPCLDYDENLLPIMVPVTDNPLSNILGQPIPKIPFVALDIEVEGATEEFPDAEKAEYPINCVAMICSDGRKFVIHTEPADLKIEGFEVWRCESEYQLLTYVTKVVENYPVVATFNGTYFDLPTLYNRCIKLGMLKEAIIFERKKVSMLQLGATFKRQVHLDLYTLLSNQTIQNYVYGSSYKFYDLDTIGKALVGYGTLPIDWSKSYTTEEVAKHCIRDTQIVYDILTTRDYELFNVIFSVCRICCISPEDMCVWGTGKWVQFMMLWHHKRRGCVIPNRQQLLTDVIKSATKAIIKGKKYKGASVLKPKKGLHFNVKVMDGASLYTTIISRHRLSYESIKVPGLLDCPHEKCKVENFVPGTPYYVCYQSTAIVADVLGELRDVRVNEIKPRAKTSSLWNCISQAVKTVLNAGYGVFSSDKFSMYYVPLGESVTAYERFIIDELVKKAKELGMVALFGDTDSIGLTDNPKIQELVEWSAGPPLEIDLEEDKTYVWLGLTTRKKNYLGVTTKGKTIIKGLQGQKVHTPPLVTEAFNTIVEIVKPMVKPEDFEGMNITGRIKEVITKDLNRLEAKEYPLESWCFKVIAKFDGDTYKSVSVNPDTGKVRKVSPPMHVRALIDAKEQVRAGRVVTFVKTTSGPKLVQNATVEGIDTEAYFDIYRSSLEQVTDALGIRFYEAASIPRLEEVKL